MGIARLLKVEHNKLEMTANDVRICFQVIIGKRLESIRLKDEHYTYYLDDAPLFGLMFVRILPPKKLNYPFLPMETKDGRIVSALCKKCADEQMIQVCQHTGN